MAAVSVCYDHICNCMIDDSGTPYYWTQGHNGTHEVGRLCENVNDGWHNYSSRVHCWTCEHTANSGISDSNNLLTKP